MTRQTMIEVRRHIRAIDLALKKEIDLSVERIIDPTTYRSAWCGHATCDPMKECQKKEAVPAKQALTIMQT